MAKRITQEQIEQINEIYQNCKNMSQTARELNISVQTVKRYLTKESLSLKDSLNDDRDALFYYIFHLFGKESNGDPVSKWNLTQMSKFNSQGISYKMQLLTLKWYYEIQKNPIKSQYRTIGIIPFIVNDAGSYYKREQQKRNEIEKNIKQQLEKDRIEVQYNPADYIGRKKKMIDLNSIVDKK